MGGEWSMAKWKLSQKSQSSLGGQSPKQSIDNQYSRLLRLMARNDD